MKMLRNMIVAFSMYSRIPMPIFTWKEDDTKYAIAFLPLIGLVIGALEYGMLYAAVLLELPILVQALLWILIPLLITGGFHIDGFMDVHDALNSYQPKEKKLEILKDPHIGAFAVIALVMYGCAYLAAIYWLLAKAGVRCAGRLEHTFLPLCLGFMMARAVGALLSLRLKLAKDNGMLHEETKGKNRVGFVILGIQLLCCVGLMACANGSSALAMLLALAVFSFWYKRKCEREFGGITGDTAGYYIVQAELILVLTQVLVTMIGM